MDDQHEDQAKELRQRFEQSKTERDEKRSYTKDIDDEDSGVQEGIDVLGLPPRSRLHEEKKQKVRLKISYAMIRLMVIIFILLVVLLLTYPYWKDTFFNTSHEEVVGAQTFDQSTAKDDARFRLSKEIKRQVEGPAGEFVTYEGRLYMTLKDETLVQIVDRFYQTPVMLDTIKDINHITSTTDVLPEGTRLFLPNVKK